ncbi:hypothetical protein AGOR_G00121070 [Albula goreensis]|uniref:XK-related protein n=1 Tax=Albula goreensis TaxID=1534307 RepID=A0A8T3DCG3_9TELE|nr:hypothetical protein AGOR_G00121070 [Albula goreensis]
MERTFSFQYPLPDFLLTLLGLALFLLDMVLDVKLVVALWQEGQRDLVAALVVLLLGSSGMVQLFSWLWYSYDSQRPQTKVEGCVHSAGLLWLCHILQLGMFLRYAALLETSLLSFTGGSSDLEGQAVYQTHDLSMLRLFETFFESAPQLVLMVLIIIWHEHEQVGLLTVLKAAGSAVSIAWTVAMYHRSLRSFLVEKAKQGWGSSALYFLWNLLLIAPRLASLALFYSALPLLGPAHFLLLWFPLFLWAWLQGTAFMDSTMGEWLYRAVIGVIWYFSWFNVAEGRTVVRSLIHHGLMAVDSAILLLVWWRQWDHAMDGLALEPIVFFVAIPSCYLLGLLLKVAYYRHCHPSLGQQPQSDTVDFRLLDTRPSLAQSDTETDSAPCTDPLMLPQASPSPATDSTPSTIIQNKRMKRLAANFYS